MPYINQDRRDMLDDDIDGLISSISDGAEQHPELLAGDLNYAITRLLDGVYPNKRYHHMNEIVGILECAKMEFYRRIAAPYEDQKRHDEGDAYGLYPERLALHQDDELEDFTTALNELRQDPVVREVLDEISKIATRTAERTKGWLDKL